MRCGDLESALTLHAAMIDKQCASVQGATSAIKGLVTAGRFDEARQIFEQMSSPMITMNCICNPTPGDAIQCNSI